MHSILGNCGFLYLEWQRIVNVIWITNAAMQRIKDQFVQKRSVNIVNSSKCHIYKTLKLTFGYEKYLNILPSKFCKIFAKFRMSDHRLSVKTVRCLGIPHNEKLCTLCNDNHIADKMRSVQECNGLSCIRLKYLESRFRERANIFLNFVN